MTGRIVESETLKDIFFRADLARRNSAAFAIVGEPGTGKTTALRAYCANDPKAHLFTASHPQRTVTAVLMEISTLFGIPSYKQSQNVLYQNLVYNFEVRGTRGEYLVIDEFQDLHHDAKRTVFKFNDHYGLPLILAGNRDVLRRTRSAASGFDQISDRVRYWLELAGPTRGDIEAFCIDYNVALAAHPFMIEFGQGRSLRDITNVLSEARDRNPDRATLCSAFARRDPRCKPPDNCQCECRNAQALKAYPTNRIRSWTINALPKAILAQWRQLIRQPISPTIVFWFRVDETKRGGRTIGEDCRRVSGVLFRTGRRSRQRTGHAR